MRVSLALVVLIASVVTAVGHPIEGFGAATIGGTGGELYTVTSLGDSGPGTLRDAMSESDRYIVFDVGGTIELYTMLQTFVSDITVDGTTAPAPGITIRPAIPDFTSALVVLRGHDIIIANLRFRDSPDPDTGDNLRIYGTGAYNIAVTDCSFSGAQDGNFDITEGAHDITVQWCILSGNIKNQLLAYGNDYNVTLHHNLYEGYERNPQLNGVLLYDLVNNVIFNWRSYGVRLRGGAYGNVVGNYFLPGPDTPFGKYQHAIHLYGDEAPWHMSGNVIPDECTAVGVVRDPFIVPLVDQQSATEAIYRVLLGAGAMPRDVTDEAVVMSLLNVLNETKVEPMTFGMIKAMYR